MTGTEPQTIAEIVADLAGEDRPTASELAGLSALDGEDLDTLKRAWARLDPARRREIVARLVELAEDNVELSFDSVFQMCLKDPDPEVRKAAIEGLWENEQTYLIAPLTDMLAHDASDMVRAAAATALGRFTLRAEHGRLRSEHLSRIHGELVHALNDESGPDEVRRRALESLAPLSRPEVTSAIRDAYNGQNQRLKVSALHAMGRNCDPGWMPILMAELDSTDAEMRFEAAVALGELGEEEAVPRLIPLCADTDSEVQSAAIEALGKIGGRRAREYLQSCLSSRSQAIRDAAAEALREAMANEEPLSPQL